MGGMGGGAAAAGLGAAGAAGIGGIAGIGGGAGAAGILKGCAAGAAAAGALGAPIAALIALPEIMRVNSPGPELMAGAATTGIPAVAGGGSGGGGTRGVSDSLWINRVTLPGSTDEGAGGGAGVYDANGSAGFVWNWGWRGAGAADPVEPSVDKRPVALMEPSPWSAAPGPGLKLGVGDHLLSAGTAGEGAGGV